MAGEGGKMVEANPSSQEGKQVKQTFRAKIASRFAKGQSPQEILRRLKGKARVQEKASGEALEPFVVQVPETFPDQDQVDIDSNGTINPSEEYRRALIELKSEASSYDRLKGKVEQKSESKDEKPPREFTAEDRARHQALLVEATKGRNLVGRLKRPEEFIKLVEYLETNVFWRDSTDVQVFDSPPSAGEEERMKKEWADKGQEVHFYNRSSDGKYVAFQSINVPRQVKVHDVSLLKDIANTVHDPVAALEALRKSGLYSLHDILNMSGVSRGYDKKSRKGLIRFLSSLNGVKVVQMINTVQNLKRPGTDYLAEGQEGYNRSLVQLSKSKEFARFTSETFEKIDILSKAMGRRVSISELPKYQKIIADEDSFNLLVAALNNKPDDQYFGDLVSENINRLKQDNLIKPLATLLDSGISGFGAWQTADLGKRPDYDWYQKLAEAVGGEDVKSFLENKQMQDFAKLMRRTFGQQVPLGGVVALFEKREEVIAFLGATITEADRDAWSEPHNYFHPVNDTVSFFSDDERSKIFFDPDFQEYIVRLQADTGTVFNMRDYTSLFKPDEYRQGAKSLPVELYKMRKTLDFFQYEGVAEIIKGIRSPHHMDEYRQAARNLEHYSSIASFASSENGRKRIMERLGTDSKLDISSLSDEDFLVLATFQDFNKDFQRFILAEDPSFPRISPDVFSRYRMVHKIFGLQNLDEDFAREVLGYNGQLTEHGKPTKAFVDLMISHKLVGGIERFLTPDILVQYGDSERKPLELLINLPNQLQLLLGDEVSFPSLSPDRLRTYVVLNSIFKYGDTTRMDKEVINAVSASATPEEFFDKGIPTRKFVDILISKKRFYDLPSFLKDKVLAQYKDSERKSFELLISSPDQIKILLGSEDSFPDISPERLRTYLVLNNIFQHGKINGLDTEVVDAIITSENPEEFFDSGVPTRKLIDLLISKKQFGALPGFLSEEALNRYYSENERSVLATWQSLPDNLRKEVIQEAPGFPDLSPQQAAKYETIGAIYSLIKPGANFYGPSLMSADLLKVDADILGQIPAKFGWLSDPKKSDLTNLVFHDPLFFSKAQKI